jgi:cytochrome c oxidase subunit II
MDLNNAFFSTVFNTATEQNKAIVDLHYIVLVVCIVIASTVTGLLTFIVIKFRHRQGDGEPFQDHGNTKYEIAWTAIPFLILTVLAILTAIVMQQVSPPVGARQPDVIVNAHQFWWEYRY